MRSGPYTEVAPRQFRFTSTHDVQPLVAALGRHHRPGSAIILFLDRDRWLVDFLIVNDGGDQLVEVLEVVCDDHDTEVASLLIVTDRTGQMSADRPDDELIWMELVGIAASARLKLLDWFVVFGTHAFSIAEFAPLPAQW